MRDISYHILPYLFVGMRRSFSMEYFSKRRISHLAGKSLALVPTFADPGDITCRSVDEANDPTFVFRKVPETELPQRGREFIDAEIMKFTSKKRDEACNSPPEYRYGPWTDTLFDPNITQAGHYKFIGKCVHEPWGPEMPNPKPEAFAIH